MAYSYSEYYSYIKKSNEILTHTTTLMNLETIIQGKIARHKNNILYSCEIHKIGKIWRQSRAMEYVQGFFSDDKK